MLQLVIVFVLGILGRPAFQSAVGPPPNIPDQVIVGFFAHGERRRA